ncbi:MAG TPA: asparagine synthetase B, partial [Flavobacterium sp.]|nr:asparagine synthetase B [Flavobacterium sp.]
MFKVKTTFLSFLFLICYHANASFVLIPMEAEGQQNHLKAYGITFWALEKNYKVSWLLNYRGGSFLLPDAAEIKKECQIRGVTFELLSEAQTTAILDEISSPSQNQETVVLEKAPKIAVYTPKGKQPWDDAVTLVLTYAEIPYTEVYDQEVLSDQLILYDWLHLHHEDFTGQYGKFFSNYKNAPWYIEQKNEAEELAKKLGFNKVSEAKRAVAIKIRDFVIGGGFMFAMCSATDSFDIALSAENVDICEPMFDGDASDANYQSKIDYSNTFAFKDYILEKSPMVYEFSDIDTTNEH